ncbi:MAG TPA: hypothetical protein VJ653_07955 [Acidimicrobiales bacterium]|nr:hypothetical protein [Acidimicrobiales bacterium]
MEILFELLFEVVFQFVGEVVLELGFRALGRLLGNRFVRLAIGAGAGFGGGYWWGARLTELGRTEPPRSLWVSIGLAVVLGSVALVKVLRDDPPRFPPDGRLARIGETFTPWRWPAGRLAAYALVNVAVAAGIATGFDPRAVP